MSVFFFDAASPPHWNLMMSHGRATHISRDACQDSMASTETAIANVNIVVVIWTQTQLMRVDPLKRETCVCCNFVHPCLMETVSNSSRWEQGRDIVIWRELTHEALRYYTSESAMLLFVRCFVIIREISVIIREICVIIRHTMWKQIKKRESGQATAYFTGEQTVHLPPKYRGQPLFYVNQRRSVAVCRI